MHAASGEGGEWKGHGGMPGVSQAAWKEGGCPGPAWLLREEYHGEDLAPTRLLWLLMVKRWPGARMEAGRAIREDTAIALGPPQTCYSCQALFVSLWGLLATKIPPAEAKRGLFCTGTHACPCWSRACALWTALWIPSGPAQMYPSVPPPVVPGRCSIPPR